MSSNTQHNAFQVATKALFPILKGKHLRQCFNFLEQIYVVNGKSVENRPSFMEFTVLLTKIMKTLVFIGIFVYITYITSPAILYLFDDSHLESILPWILPGTQPGSENKRDYIINQFYNAYAISLTIAFYILFALLFTFLLLHFALLSELMRNKLRAINRALAKGELSQLEIKFELKNVIVMHHELSS